MECIDTCPYCTYLEDGDFFCAAAPIPEVTIVDWVPKQCVCPSKQNVICQVDELIQEIDRRVSDDRA